MKKNVASQAIGAQMITAADGTAFTSAVTVYVTGNAGTQAIGSVGSGVCTHEGNGFHTYAPAQAETNYDHIAFTFIGTGAVPATVQVFPAFPQTGDSFVRIGATGSGLTTLATQASVNTVDTVVDAVKVVTDAIPDSGAMTSIATAAALTTVDTVVDSIETKVDIIDTTCDDVLTDTGTTLPATLALIAGYIDTEVGTVITNTTNIESKIDTVDTVVDAIKVVTDALPDAGALTSVFTELTDIQGATFSSATDSLEAIRDRGDVAWLTGAGGSAPTVAQIRTEMDTNSTKLADIVADTNELQTDDIPAMITALNNISTTEVNAEVDTALADYDGPTNTEMLAAFALLNDISAAEVNAEVVDVLATDTYAEPGQGTPAATASLAAKINYLFKAWRNKSEMTATEYSLYDDAGTTVDQKSTVADNGTTATKGEVITGP